MKRIAKLLLIAVISIILTGAVTTGCSSREQATKSMPVAPMPAPPLSPVPLEGMSRTADMAVSRSEASSAPSDTDRKIVKNGYITLEASDILDSMDKISAMAQEFNGYVVSSTKLEDADGNIAGKIAIRVPVNRFEEALSRLRKLAVNVPNENTDSRDITEEYTDLKAQLRNLEATESQYLALLEKAKTVEEILKVQQALSNVRREIERIKGRLQYLDRTSDMSLIDITLRKPKPLSGTGWSALNTLYSALRGFITFLKVIVDIAIWIVIFCPIWIPVLVILVRRHRKKKNQAKKA